MSNMKCVYLLVGLVVFAMTESNYYETENDYIDVDAVLSDPPLLQSFLDCFLDRKPCTSLAASYKRHLQDSVLRACDRCNLRQLQRYAKFLFSLRVILPEEYNNIKQKYDPYGIYFDRLEAELAKYLDSSSPSSSSSL